MDKNNHPILNTIHSSAKALVGILCKRIEILEKNKNLNPQIYKDLVKEHVYEHFRHLSQLVELHLQLEEVIFEETPKEQE